MTAEGGLVIADSVNHVVRHLHEGKVTTLTPTSFQLPVDVALDASEAIWVVDSFSNTILQVQTNKNGAGN